MRHLPAGRHAFWGRSKRGAETGRQRGKGHGLYLWGGAGVRVLPVWHGRERHAHYEYPRAGGLFRHRASGRRRECQAGDCHDAGGHGDDYRGLPPWDCAGPARNWPALWRGPGSGGRYHDFQAGSEDHRKAPRSSRHLYAKAQVRGQRLRHAYQHVSAQGRKEPLWGRRRPSGTEPRSLLFHGGHHAAH